MEYPTGTMTRRTLAAGALASLAVPMLARPAQAARIRLGAYGGAGCDGAPEVAKFQSWLGRPVDIVVDFLDKRSWKHMVQEGPWMAGCWRDLPAKGLSVAVPMLVDEGKPSLADGSRGAYDQHFRDVARAFIDGGFRNAIMRIGWEFNGDWYPWSARGNPAAFVACYRRIVATMRRESGAQFRFDWCPTVAEGPVEAAYPGDDVVDIIGLDCYNQSWPVMDPESRWQRLLDHPAGLRWHQRFANAHGKPRSFPEWGTGTRPDGHGGGDDPLYIRNMIAWMQQGGPIDYACYWNYQADDYDAKVTNDRFPQAARALRTLLPSL